MKSGFLRLLKWSEKYTNTNMSYLAKGGTYLITNHSASSLVSLLLAIAFANFLSPTNYGIYQYIISIIALFSITTLGGINTSTSRASALGADRALYSGTKTKIRYGLLGGILSVILSVYYFYQANEVLGLSFLIAAFFIPLKDSLNTHISFLQGKKLFKKMSIFEVVTHTTSSLALIVTLYFTKNIITLVLVYLLSWTLIRAYFFYKTGKHVNTKSGDGSDHVKYGKRLSAITIFTRIVSTLDKIIIWHFTGPIQVAVYTFALTIPLRLTSFVKIINRLAFPKFSLQNNPSDNNALLKKIGIMFLFLTPAVVLYIILAPYIFKIFFPQYTDSIIFSQIISLLLLLQPFTLIETKMSAQAKERPLYIYKIISSLAKVILLIVLVPILNIWGAVIAFLGSKLFDSIYLVYLSRRIT